MPTDNPPQPAEPRLVHALLMLVSLAFSIYLGFRLSIFPIAPGGDPSGAYANNYATAHGFRFGRDIFWTYGPYGYLLEAIDLGSNAVRRITWDIAWILITAIAAAAYVAKAVQARFAAKLIALFLLVYTLDLQSPDYRWFCLAILLALLGLHASGRTEWVARLLAAALAGFLLLVKLSLGVGAVVTVVAIALIAPSPREALRRFVSTAAASLGGLMAGWFAYEWSPGGLGRYLALGWELTGGYASALSSTNERWWVTAAWVVVFVALVVAWALALRTHRARLTLVALAAPLLVACRHALVRQDSHLRLIVAFGAFVLALLIIESIRAWLWERIFVATFVVALPLVIVWCRPESAPSPAAGLTTLGSYFMNPLRFEIAAQVRGLRNLDAGWRSLAHSSREALASRVLPPSMIAKIGRATVDSYPWDTSYIPANGLAWANRPMTLSYLACTPRLDELDAAFFESSRRPQFLLWHPSELPMQSIDNRHLFWDEPKTLRSIMTNYQLVDAAGEVLLLQHTRERRFEEPQTIGTGVVRWGEWIGVPNAEGVVLAALKFRRRPSMAIRRSVFREDPVYLSVRFEGGDELSYRAVPDQFAIGLWINPLPVTAAELAAFFRGEPFRRVTAIRVHGSPSAQLASQLEVAWLRLPPHGAHSSTFGVN